MLKVKTYVRCTYACNDGVCDIKTAMYPASCKSVNVNSWCCFEMLPYISFRSPSKCISGGMENRAHLTCWCIIYATKPARVSGRIAQSSRLFLTGALCEYLGKMLTITQIYSVLFEFTMVLGQELGTINL